MGWKGIALAMALSACGGGDSPGSDVTDAAGQQGDAASADAGPPPLPRLLYLADQDEDDIHELYLAGLSDELLGPTKVNAPTGELLVRQFGWSPAGDHLFYTVGEIARAGIELYIVPVDGAVAGEPVRVEVDLARSEGGEVIGTIQGVTWSPDGSRLAFAADQEFQVTQLFVVELGSEDAPTALTESDTGRAVWSPDSATIAFVDVASSPDRLSLVTVAGGEVTPAADVSGLRDFDALSWSPDGRHLSFLARTLANPIDQAYVVDLDGDPSGAVRVSPVEVDDGTGVTETVWSPDSSKLAFYYDTLDPARRWYVVDVSGGEPAPASEASPGIGADGSAFWSPDSRWLTFTGVDEGPREIFAVDATAPTLEPIQVNPPLPPDGGVIEALSGCVSGLWSRDAASLTYLAVREEDQPGALWTSAMGEGRPREPVQMSGPLVENGGIFCAFAWSPDGVTLLYAATQDDRNITEIFAVEASDPGSSVQVNGELVLEGNVVDEEGVIARDLFKWSPAGDWIAYLADQEVNERVELYAVKRAALGESLRVSSLAELGDVYQYAWAP